MQDSAEALLWKRWRRDGDVVARDRLIVIHSPWARMVARDVFARMHSLGDAWQDCTQNALIGLVEAVDRFDPDRGASFQTYARYRVRGAVFNGLRTLRESLARGPSDSDRSHVLRERFESLDESHNEDPFEAFVASSVGLALGFLLEANSLPERETAPDAYAEHERVELRHAVGTGIDQLDERDQAILTMHYYHHVPFVEIAQTLGVTKGRISQLHKRALERLRMLLSDRMKVDY